MIHHFHHYFLNADNGTSPSRNRATGPNLTAYQSRRPARKLPRHVSGIGEMKGLPEIGQTS
jgi:hypothetical protein